MISVWAKKRIGPGAFIALLLALFLTLSVSATVFESVQNQFTISNSGTSASQFTISNAGTSESWFTIGQTGPYTTTQTATLWIVIAFGTVAIILILLFAMGQLTVGTFILAAIAAVLAMLGMIVLSNVLSTL